MHEIWHASLHLFLWFLGTGRQKGYAAKNMGITTGRSEGGLMASRTLTSRSKAWVVGIDISILNYKLLRNNKVVMCLSVDPPYPPNQVVDVL
jgi:hypothetical protein